MAAVRKKAEDRIAIETTHGEKSTTRTAIEMNERTDETVDE
jgi:hypothetical protein